MGGCPQPMMLDLFPFSDRGCSVCLYERTSNWRIVLTFFVGLLE